MTKRRERRVTYIRYNYFQLATRQFQCNRGFNNHKNQYQFVNNTDGGFSATAT